LDQTRSNEDIALVIGSRFIVRGLRFYYEP
jgi:hypothetical protein